MSEFRGRLTDAWSLVLSHDLQFPLIRNTCSMNDVKARLLLYAARCGRIGLLALVALALSGCWEKVHYQPPTGDEVMPARTTRRAAPEPPRDEAAQFADDFASSFEPEPETPSRSEPLLDDTEQPARYADTTPIPDDEPPRDAETPPAEATQPQPPSPTPVDPAANTRRVAWLLGSKLTVAALANERGGNRTEVEKWFQQSQTLARLLGSDVDPMPPVPTGGTPANGVEYVFAQGQRIGGDLATNHSDEHAAVFELAVKSYVLDALYQPHAPVAKALTDAIAHAGERARLPAKLFQPLKNAVADGAAHAVVHKAVLQLNHDVDVHLSSSQP